jgi:hypothetical protein
MSAPKVTGAGSDPKPSIIQSFKRSFLEGASMFQIKAREIKKSTTELGMSTTAPNTKTVSIYTSIEESIKAAMQVQDTSRLTVLVEIRAALQGAAKVNNEKFLFNEDCYPILKQMAKQRRTSIKAFESTGYPELVDTALYELTVIESFIPSISDENTTLE